MGEASLRLRKPVVAIAALLVMLAGLIAGYSATRQTDSDPRGLTAVELLANKNDGKDNCPNDGNAGGGNDGNCAPSGSYGNVNPNDGKDNCPTDGNAGKGNDNKGPNGGCRS